VSKAVVLNTRSSDQAAELSSLLTEAGYTPVEAPAIAVVRAWVASQIAPLRDHDYAWLVLPSQNAARFLREALGGELPRTNILCGQATAQALHLDAAQTLARFSAAAALAALRPLVRAGDRVLVPRAEEGHDELIDGLKASGVRVDAPVVYRTVQA